MDASWFELDGCRLVFDDRGTGRPVVFSHGAGADRHMFDAQVEALVAAGFRVITWDLRLHGESRPSATPVTPARLVADLLGLCDHLGLRHPVLIGQSLGGNVSQALVRERPDLASALVVIDSAWNTDELNWLDRSLVRVAAPSLALVPRGMLPGFMARASASTESGVAYADRVFSAMPKRDFVEVWRATTGFLRPEPHYLTPVPLLLIRGDRDRTGNIATAMPRWAAHEGVAEVVVAGAGHLANVDAPARVNSVIVDFLASGD